MWWILLALAVATGACDGRDEAVVIDCTPGVGRCVEREPTGRLANVRYIPDAQNFIDGPFTREQFTVESLGVRLVRPWDLEFLPDSSMLVTERVGRIQHIENGSPISAYELKPVTVSLAGLLGLAVDPDFESNRHVYIYYTYALAEPLDEKQRDEDYRIQVLNRISRLTMGRHSLFEEKTLLEAIPGSGAHCGGRLEFGPDGKLYATTGDGYVPERAQDPDSLAGKVLRINPDGSVPEDNPFPGNPVYSLGHRNPQGLAWNPVTGALFLSEHGERRFDEINVVRPGANYGWGHFECRRPIGEGPPPASAVFPLVCFNRFTMAPSGMQFVADPDSAWYGSLFVAGLRGSHLRRYEFPEGRDIRDEIFFVADGRDYLPPGSAGDPRDGMDTRIRDVEYHAGSLYLIGDRFGLIRITPR